MEIIKTKLNDRRGEKGALTFLEGERDIPFAIKRVYYIYDVAPGERRGFHAHKRLQQYLVCVAGSCKVLMDDAREKTEVVLDDPGEGLYVGPGMWHEMYDFSDGTVLLALASDFYSEEDYIRNYDRFIKYTKEGL